MNRRQLLAAAAGLATGPGGPIEHLERAVASGRVSGAVLQVQGPGSQVARAFGQVRVDTPFLLASITKPMTAAVVMSLVQAGRLGLDDPVRRHLPEFASPLPTVRHLLCHTSGLPDMLPDNLELRRRHAPLSAFVAGACRAPLLFPPGSQVRYQSMGLLLAGELAARAAHTPLPELMRRTLFQPLGMSQSSLGLGGRKLEDTARCQVPDEPWGWNSAYWRDLGSPWGGAHGTAADLTRLLRFFARPGAAGPLSAASVATMLSRQTPESASDRYGLGWRLGMHGPRAFGHSGATGVEAWMDPARDLSVVLLTTLPAAQWSPALLKPVGDLVSAAV
jgi:beta-lactamase class C